MDLNTVTEVRSAAEVGVGGWRPGDAWLAGGTYLFSEPQPQLTRLLDLAALDWEPLRVSADGLEIAATCTVAQLARFGAAPHWTACHPLMGLCCQAFLASFKIWNLATVGGNLCNALPAGPMISLTAALDAECLILTPQGPERRLSVTEFVTGAGTNALFPGELLRSIQLPDAALRSRAAFRQGSLHRHGRSAALLVGRLDPDGTFVLTVTASTARPTQLRFPALPEARELRDAIEAAIPADAYFDDIHGLPAWRRQLTLMYAQEIRTELAGAAPETAPEPAR